ncbi:MAG: DUF4430 domain-containing protein [Patescibacteria group bacterium]
MKRNIWAIVVVLVIIVAGGFAYNQYVSNSTPSTSASPSPTTSDQFSYSGQDGQTALDLLKSKATVVTSGEGVNAFVTSINGRAASDSKKEYWSFLVNGAAASVGAGSYTTKSTDTILWKIATF